MQGDRARERDEPTRFLRTPSSALLPSSSFQRGNWTEEGGRRKEEEVLSRPPPSARVRVLLLTVVCLALSGCADLPGDDDAQPLRFFDPVPVSQDSPGAEPVIAVAPDGTAYVEGIGRQGNGNVNKVYRSTDGGASWQDVTPPDVGEERSNDGFLAVGDDGTVYASNVFSLTFQLFRSDDRGDSWTRLSIPPLPATMHRHWYQPIGDTLHVTIESFPASYAPFLAGQAPLPGSDNDPQGGMWYVRSDDRGATWTTPTRIDPIVNFAGQSNMVVSADGQRIYVGRYQEDAAPPDYTYDDGHWYMLASEDGGATWERREMLDLTTEMSTAVPGLSLAPGGSRSEGVDAPPGASDTLWFAWTQEFEGGSTLHLANSTDGGVTWSEPWRPAGANGTHAMAWSLAKPDGRIGLMWYQADVPGMASQVDADWFVHYMELGRDPVRVTPAPVHQGNICAKGPACQDGEDRSLLDYPWMDVGPEGEAWLVYPSTEWELPSAYAVVSRQNLD